jgi:plasmid replication initiation protein
VDIVKIKTNLVVSSNDLVHAKYDLSLWQKRVFVYAISLLKKDSIGFEPIRMNISDIIKFYKSSDGVKTYNAIVEAPKSLDTTLEIPYISKEGNLRYGFVKLLQDYTIPADNQESNQYIELCFNNSLKPHLLELKEKFLKYDIRNVINLQSTYSFRMFEILKSYEYKKEIELDIEYLREILEAKNIYKSYKDFKKRIIDKAQEDLLKYCDIGFNYKEKKGTKGKKIESLLFIIYKNQINKQDEEEKPQEKLKIHEEKKSLPHLHLEVSESNLDKLFLRFSPTVITDFSVTPTVFLKLLEKYTEGEVLQAIDMTKQEKEKGKIQNIAGFFVDALKNGYQNPKEVVKRKETEKNVKLEAQKVAEQDSKNRMEDAKRKEGERKMMIVKRLIADNSPIIKSAIEDIEKGMFKTSYDSQKTIEHNLESNMFVGAMFSALQKIDPSIFNT